MLFVNELKLLEPFGAGNTKPIFRLQGARVLNSTRIGADRNHLRLDLCDQAGHQFKLLAFFAPEAWFTITPEDQIEPLIHLEQNYFQGVTSVEGTIVDIDFLHSGTM